MKDLKDFLCDDAKAREEAFEVLTRDFFSCWRWLLVVVVVVVVVVVFGDGVCYFL